MRQLMPRSTRSTVSVETPARRASSALLIIRSIRNLRTLFFTLVDFAARAPALPFASLVSSLGFVASFSCDSIRVPVPRLKGYGGDEQHDGIAHSSTSRESTKI